MFRERCVFKAKDLNLVPYPILPLKSGIIPIGLLWILVLSRSLAQQIRAGKCAEGPNGASTNRKHKGHGVYGTAVVGFIFQP